MNYENEIKRLKERKEKLDKELKSKADLTLAKEALTDKLKERYGWHWFLH